MKRNVSLEEISDGKLYTSNDMVKADCGDCAGCSSGPAIFKFGRIIPSTTFNSMYWASNASKLISRLVVSR